MKKSLQLLVITFLLSFNIFSQTGTGCWREISAGANNFCLAIKMDGTLWGWGQNGNLLGLNGNMANQNLPIQIGTANDWMTVSAGANHSLAVKTNGTLWAWGNGSTGQLGNGNNASTWTLTQAGTATDWIKVSAGGGFSLAIKNTGTLWAFGANNLGQLGINNLTNQNIPVQVGTASNWVQIDAGNQHSLALDAGGFMYAWGDNTFGQLGDGSYTSSIIPIPITPTTNYSSVSAGLDHSMALDNNGLLYTWGNNVAGQLCDGANAVINIPTAIINSDGSVNFYISISAGSSFSLAIKNDGTLWSGGYNLFGMLAHGAFIQTSTNTLVQVGTNTNWQIISAGNSHSMAMDTTTGLFEAGRNWEGQIATGVFSFYYGNLQSVICPTTLANQPITKQNLEINVSPNPTNDFITIHYNLENESQVILKLTTVQGQVIQENKIEKANGIQTNTLDLSNQASGLYFVSITTETGNFTSKVMKK